ncbi:MAG: hypothetical protein KatS3mg118_0465 [Paracoccaceae bacterium]|nr:MAG: hypothetical protein KatS3mg118_0465 [Paracoccaceae bacterium]
MTSTPRAIRLTVLTGLVALLAACGTGSGDPQRQSLLRAIGLRQPAPDEFLVVERKPLEMPPALNALPPPDPGGVNRVDPQPRAEVNALLRGAGTRVDQTAPSPGEQALLARIGADAADPAIRSTLGQEDARLQAQRGRYAIRSLFGRQTYDPYADQVLDPYAELERLRAAGVPTPAAPPPPPPPDRSRLF